MDTTSICPSCNAKLEGEDMGFCWICGYPTNISAEEVSRIRSMEAERIQELQVTALEVAGYERQPVSWGLALSFFWSFFWRTFLISSILGLVIDIGIVPIYLKLSAHFMPVWLNLILNIAAAVFSAVWAIKLILNQKGGRLVFIYHKANAKKVK